MRFISEGDVIEAVASNGEMDYKKLTRMIYEWLLKKKERSLWYMESKLEMKSKPGVLTPLLVQELFFLFLACKFYSTSTLVEKKLTRVQYKLVMRCTHTNMYMISER